MFENILNTFKKDDSQKSQGKEVLAVPEGGEQENTSSQPASPQTSPKASEAPKGEQASNPAQAPKEENPAEGQAASPATPTASPNENTQNQVVLPSAPLKEETLGATDTLLPSSEQRKLLKERRKIPGWILALKYTSIFLMISTLMGFSWFTIDLEPDNSYLDMFGLQENSGIRHKILKQRKNILTTENSEYDSNIRRIDQQIDTKKYSVSAHIIKQVKDEQFVWFDQLDSEGEIEFGLLDSAQHMADYFNSKTFQHAVLTGGGNQISIRNLSGDRRGVNFTVQGANLFGKVFFLNTEFIRMINSFPFLKNGSLRSFAKEKDNDGNDNMSFVLSMSVQGKEENDFYDEYFSRFEDWFIATHAVRFKASATK